MFNSPIETLYFIILTSSKNGVWREYTPLRHIYKQTMAVKCPSKYMATVHSTWVVIVYVWIPLNRAMIQGSSMFTLIQIHLGCKLSMVI